MARAVFEIAKDFQDKIFGDLAQAQGFKDSIRESVMADFQIPERLSQTRLNQTNNMFALEDRLGTYQTDLEKNRLDAQLGLRDSRFKAATADQQEEVDRLKLDNAVEEERAAQRQYKFAAANQEKEEEIAKLKLDAELGQAKSDIQENLNSFEKYQSEREFNQILGAMDDWESSPKGLRVEFMWERAKGINASRPTMELVKLKIKEEMSDDIAALQVYEENQLKIAGYNRIAATGGQLTASQKADMAYLIQKQDSIRNSAAIDFMGLKFVVDRGIIPYSQLGLASSDLLNQMTAVQPLGAEGAASVDPAAAAAPAPEATPVPSDAPVDATAAIDSVGIGGRAVAEADVNLDQTPVMLTERDLAADSKFTSQQITDILKALPGETKDVIMKEPVDVTDALKTIDELSSIGEMLNRTANENQAELFEIIAERIVAIEKRFTNG